MSIFSVSIAESCDVCTIALETGDLQAMIKCRQSGGCLTIQSTKTQRKVKTILDKSISELKKRCRELKIKGFSQATKKDRMAMTNAILSHEKNIKNDVLFGKKSSGEYINIKKEVEEYEIMEEVDYSTEVGDI